jgi:sugar/nucleoside kinase (ribokinase family)
MRATTTVLLAGHVTLDRYGDALAAGGTVSYAARTYLGLGARVRAVTAAAGDYPMDTLAGVEADVAAAPRTTTFVNSYGADGVRAQRVEAVAPPLDPGRLPARWLEADVVHLAPILGEVDLARWLAVARGRMVGIGVQGWVRAVRPDGAVAQPAWRPSPDELRGVHAACLGEDDLRGQGDLLDRLVAAVPVVVFTHGACGCEVILRRRTVRVGTFRTREVDPTGAGDVFSAGFFLALARGADPADAARLGAAAASIVVEGRGGDALSRIAEAPGRAAAVPVVP